MVFPHGRLASRRWIWLPWLLAGAMTAHVVGTAFSSHAQVDTLATWQNPLSSPSLNAIADPASGMALLLSLVAALGAVAQLVVRWRRGESRLRQQIALLAAAALLALLAAPLSLAGFGGAWLFAVTLLPLPVAVGYAVLARGRYDLSTAANRTLVWVTLSAAVIGIYALVIAGVGSLLDVRGARWLPWLAAAVVAMALAPLRDALQRVVNRLIFGRWDDPYEVLARLGQQLAASADVDRLLGDVASELRTALNLDRIAIRDDIGDLLAGEPGGIGEDTELPLVAYHQPVGTLHYAARTPLRVEDRRLLDNVARHLGGLLYAHRLSRELQRAREKLVLAREDERRRLRRDLHDGLGPALAAHVVRLDLALRLLPADSQARRNLETLRTDLQGTVSDLRHVVEGLRPAALDELGLEAALRQAVARLAVGSSTAVDVDASALPPLPAALEVAIYRIVSEAVANVVHHAGASSCVVRITSEDGRIDVTIADDGVGIEPDVAGGHGLHTMRERAEELGGLFRVASERGTAVHATIPIGRSELEYAGARR
jgi:signal transduction histidine kinase